MRIGSVCSCLVFVFFCLPLVSSCNAAPKIPAVVSVDMQRLMTESEPAKQASEHLGEVRAVLQKGFEALRETYKNAPKEQQEAIFANGLAVLNRQMELETRAAAKSDNDIIAEEVGKWRKSNGVMLVISRSAVIDGDWDSADYTKTILAAVNKRKAAFAALPAVNIVKEQAGKADEETKSAGSRKK